MTTYKYTTDGKKVLVVGKLNAEQTIVQEVFVASNGQEVPSGENFVVGSLHDEPLVSWKSKKLKELEAHYEKTKADWEIRISKLQKESRQHEQKLLHKAKALLHFELQADPKQMRVLQMFMAGEINFFYTRQFNHGQILTWDSAYQRADGNEGRIESIKLVSLFGDSKGDLSYRIADYSDGSGNWRTIVPFATYEEALAHAQKDFDELAEQYVNSEGAASLDIPRWSRIEGLGVPVKAWELYHTKAKEHKLKMITDLVAKVETLRKEL